MEKTPIARGGGLRRRWVMNSLVPVIAVLFLIAALVSIALAGSYRSNAHAALENKCRAGTDYFNSYVMTGYNEYYRSAASYASGFDDADRIELQFLSRSGVVEVSTRGVMGGYTPGTGDVIDALQSGETGYYRGKDPYTGERIIAVSGLLKYNGSVVGLMRYVTATRLLDRQITLTVLGIFGITLGVIALIIVSSMIFINNVVEPVAAVTDAAKEIAGGSYGVQIPNPYTDEMGQLVDNINQMSVKIGQSEKMKNEFVSSVSHELRTPLTAINGWGETLMADQGEDPETLHRGLNIIVKESARLTKMVEELLDFSKMQDGRFTLNAAMTDLQAEFEDTIYTYQELFRQEGITLNYESGRDVYEELIYGDAERLKQVFCNLLDNARKHGGAGNRIDAALFQQGRRYVITIRDYGTGIPAKDLPHVKEKFYKGSSKARGSGIGLAVCDEIIRLHGGTFTIGNAKGGGAVVTLKIPFEKKSKE